MGWAASLEQHAVASGQHGTRAGDAEVVMAAQAWPASLAVVGHCLCHNVSSCRLRLYSVTVLFLRRSDLQFQALWILDGILTGGLKIRARGQTVTGQHSS